MTDPTQNISRHTQTEPQLSASGLTLGYEGHAVAENINFQVNRGDYLCIIGENGSGKSTLIKTLLGLTPPLAGKITFGDGLSARQIGYLPQQTDFQKDFPASCEEIALSGFLAANGLRPFYSKAQKQRVEQLFAELGIPQLIKRCYRDLSGGQQQRVLLARALCAAQKMHMGGGLQFFGSKTDYVKTPLRASFRDRGELSKFVDEAVCSRAERGSTAARRYYK